MNILVLNCGSSTVKFQIIQTDLEMMKNDSERCLASGNCEKIGSEQALYGMRATGSEGIKGVRPLRDHREAICAIFDWINSGQAGIEGVSSLKDIQAVGHRILHGGERFTKSTLIDDQVLQGISDLIPLGPLHQRPQVMGIQACREFMGHDIPQVAVFDPSFHTTMRPINYLYALPYEYYERYQIRRYGFHGTSYRYVTQKYAALTNTPIDKVNIIILHLGNGSSVCAVKEGKCLDTSMGFTPLEGLVMGTRCGDLDASILPFLMEHAQLDGKGLDDLMNKKSGLLGISGLSSDMRDIEEAAVSGHERAKLALDMFCLRLTKYIGSYFAEMHGAQAIVFTGGIGQNSPIVRAQACEGLECMGIDIDLALNDSLKRGTAGDIARADSRVKIWVIPTNEEVMIARDTFTIIRNAECVIRNS